MDENSGKNTGKNTGRKMKLSIIIGALLIISIQINAQEKEKTADQILFDKAVELHEDEELDSALISFRQFRREYPHSELIPSAHYNIGYILKEQGQVAEAKIVFKEIIESDYNEKDPGGHGLMGPQYALYKHFSCEQLADILIQENDFKEAEKYIKLFDRKYPYEHFCGNELTAYQIFKAQRYAKVYDGLGRVEDAIKQLAPHIFYTGLADNNDLIEDLISLLDRRFTIEQIKYELGKSIATLRLKESKKKGESATIELFKTTLEVNEYGLFDFSNPDYEINTKLEGREKYLEVIRTNNLYRNYGIE